MAARGGGATLATKKQKRERLARAEAERREHEQFEKRRRTVRTVVIAVAAVAAVAVVVFLISWLNKDEPVVTPDGVTAQGGVLYPAANQASGDAVEVVVYEDPLCPHCRDFETEHGEFLQEAADRGDITLEYRPIALISDDSVAPVNAMACVLDGAGRKVFVDFHDRMFAGSTPTPGWRTSPSSRAPTTGRSPTASTTVRTTAGSTR
ncbi:DsbA family protein [Solicola gregarius]|uniref:DsbA family protein n=1 Tax=Solicola gregarius TaxID=2908642 RepID=UPI00230612D5|nr:DsbA family protein [Solicola gregarius]